jgi:thymidylate synthase
MSRRYEQKYRKLLKKVLNRGIYRNDRTGVGSYSCFNLSLKINVGKHFPILTGRKMFQNTFDTEFLWFIRGETNVKRFRDAGVKIWDAWANEDGELGPVYGYQLRNFNGEGCDQLRNVVLSINRSPDSRRHIISLWNPLQLEQMALPPCYLYFQFFVNKDKLDMFVVQRSGDMFLGIPYDVALFTKILLYVSEHTGLLPNKLHINIIDAHVYSNQVDAAAEYLHQPIFEAPTYEYSQCNLKLNNYRHGKVITAKVAI